MLAWICGPPEISPSMPVPAVTGSVRMSRPLVLQISPPNSPRSHLARQVSLGIEFGSGAGLVKGRERLLHEIN